MDLAFALSANSVLDSTKNFRKMKEVINSVIEKYGVGTINYAVVVFGNTPSVRVRFTQPLDEDQLKTVLSGLTPNSKGSNIERALDEVQRLFDASSRPDARRVLILVTDKTSDSAIEDVKTSAESLRRSGIKVVPVAFGEEADKDELKVTTPDKDDLIESTGTEDPEVLAKEIMKTALEGLLVLYQPILVCLILFCLFLFPC